MEKEEQVGGDIYNTEKEAASEKTQEIRKSGDEPTDCQTGGKVADKVGRFARERKTGREASKRGRPSNADRVTKRENGQRVVYTRLLREEERARSRGGRRRRG